ncbi:MAG: flagellar hook protein FlgE [Eubacteriales bacterium]
MMRSMFSGVSGLRNHQIRMDTIGNNIANVNTVGYKKSRVLFQDMLSQNIRGASSPQGGRGGTNPQQVGLGMTVNSIDTLHTQGSSETTGKVTDMMVDGDGFFIVGDGTNNFYTRAGNFDFDAIGNMVNANGLKVQGWTATAAGVIDTTSLVSGIQIPKGQAIQPQPSSAMTFVGNLDASAAVTTAYPASVTVYDSLGQNWTMNVTFTKGAANSWTVSLTNPPVGWTTAPAIAGGPVTFNGAGAYVGGSPLTITGTPVGANAVTVAINVTGLTQFASGSNAALNSQNGYSSGVLNGYAIDKAGIITGRYSNGLTKQLAQVSLANFNNPSGMVKSGENLYTSSNNSGSAQIGTAGSGGRGDISPGKLEMSNVDLSQEFTDMIITQRGFQANSRIITTSDEMLQELVNLKR